MTKVPIIIENSPLICSSNQWTSFYMIETFMKEGAINDFFTRGKGYVSFSRYLDFCGFHESVNFKICGAITNITEY